MTKQTPDAEALTALFQHFDQTQEVPTRLFVPAFWTQVSEAQTQQVLHQIWRRYGYFLQVEAGPELAARFQRGRLPVILNVDETGSIEMLRLFPPASPLPKREVIIGSLTLQALLALLLPWAALVGVLQVSAQPLRVFTALPMLAVMGYACFTVAWMQTSLWLQRYLVVSAGVLAVVACWPVKWQTVEASEVWLNAGLTLVFAALGLWAWLGRRLPPHSLELGFPLQGQVFTVLQGGSTRAVNYHVAHAHMRYALDFVALNRWGGRAAGLYPKDPTQYAAFGAQVISPCRAVVLATEQNRPDFSPPHREEGGFSAGNYVLLGYGENKILLAHLQQGSISVAVGQQVKQGDPLGRVGNSGNTTEPHLHIHVERGGQADQAGTGVAVPARFGGRAWVRNMIWHEK